MPTPNEKKALLFLGAVVLLGGSVRAWRAWAAPVPQTPASRVGLDAQLQAVDSTHKSHPATAPKKKSRRGGAVRVDASGPLPGVPELTFAPVLHPRSRIDLDTADSASIDSLPGIGPKLAARIVHDRAVNGAFGGMDAFRTIPGASDRLLKALDTLVTFSGPQRPLNAVLSGGSTPGGNSARRGRRRTP